MIVNGTASALLPIDDRAVQYGDGCFTTMAVSKGLVEFWSQHLQRLKDSCIALQIDFNQWQPLDQQVQQLALQHPDAVIKIILSRGSGGRGYSCPEPQHPRYMLSVHAKPAHYAQWQQNGIVLGLSETRLAKQPQLAGIKHLNRLEQVLIKQSFATDIDDVLVCDIDGNMIETSASNLFWRQQGIWFTPQLDNAGVEGIMRNRIMERMQQQGIPVQQICASYQLLSQATEVFICNTLMKIVPVKRFQQRDLRIEHSRQLQQWFNQ
ncbi:aminodeoxychorismate lyase [Neptunicella sp.]|uniref:aminodeoxychorismate lyase n=1 Tax=Neptunicella sp. TaxID=2125986 RepID=UPI003F691475